MSSYSQVGPWKHRTRRQLFYLAKVYTEDLKAGEDYGRLRRGAGIAVLDYDLAGQAGCHTEYRLRDRGGNGLAELFGMHVTEPGKALRGTAAANGRIRLSNAGRGGSGDDHREKQGHPGGNGGTGGKEPEQITALSARNEP